MNKSDKKNIILSIIFTFSIILFGIAFGKVLTDLM